MAIRLLLGRLLMPAWIRARHSFCGVPIFLASHSMSISTWSRISILKEVSRQQPRCITTGGSWMRRQSGLRRRNDSYSADGTIGGRVFESGGHWADRFRYYCPEAAWPHIHNLAGGNN